jgi:hypothetical protein
MALLYITLTGEGENWASQRIPDPIYSNELAKRFGVVEH